MLWISYCLREGLRAPAWARPAQRGRLSAPLQALQSRQLVPAECSVYVQLLALYARVTRGNHSAATRERFATDSETSAAAEQAADATAKTSGAQQVRTPPPKPQHTKQATAVKNVSLSRTGVASGATHVGKLTSYSISSGHHTQQTRAAPRATAATLKHLGSR